MSTQPYAPTGYPLPVADQTQAKLATASKQVKTVFDVFAWLVLIATALTVIGFGIGAIAEHNSYLNDYDNYTDESQMYVIAALITPIYGAFLWASVKFYSIVAGYIHWRAK